MFGSSQDRARQLAGRNRRGRVSSGESCSSSRTIGSSQSIYQPSSSTTLLDSTAELPSAVTAHPSHNRCRPRANQSDSEQEDLENIKERPASPTVSQLPAGSRPFHVEQHRLQAEHLSQVLYNTLALSKNAVPPQGQFGSSRHARYGSLGTHSDTSSSIRNFTAPCHATHSSGSPLLDLLELLQASTFPHLRTSASEIHLRPQAVVSLRGGSGDDVIDSDTQDIYDYEEDQAYEQHLLALRNPQLSSYYIDQRHNNQFYKDFKLAEKSRKLEPHTWNIPICDGVAYEFFLENLTERQKHRLGKLFGPAPESNFPYAPRGRLAFFHSLARVDQCRIYGVIRSTIELRQSPDYKPKDVDSKLPPVMLSLLLSTTEDYYGSGVDGSGSLATTAASKAALNTLFDKYREADAQDKDIIGAEGTMTYLEDIGVHAEGLDSLATLEIIQTPAMGEMHREGFVKGWFERNCDTLDKQRAYMQSLKQDLPNNKELFTRVYKYTFFVAKAPGQKAVPLDNAGVFWEVLFTSPLSPVKWTTDSTPWLSWWTEFTNSEWKKSVNKDMWNETLKFAQLTLEDEAMSFWSEESSWPSVIDEFVEWVKEKRGDTKEEAMDEEY